jgi:hypothetical protein
MAESRASKKQFLTCSQLMVSRKPACRLAGCAMEKKANERKGKRSRNGWFSEQNFLDQ